MNTTPTGEPRGIRNFNPGNIMAITGLQWRGQTGVDEDGYLTFSKPVWGIRAGMVIVQNYKYFHGLNTVREIIHRWAPPPSNPTTQYVAFICQRIGVEPDAPLDLCTLAVPFAKAVCLFENGLNPYPDSLYETAKTMAHIR